MKGLEITKITKKYVIINDEKVWFDEAFEKVPAKDEFELWLKNIKVVLEKVLVTENK